MTPTAGIIATLLFGDGFCLILKVIGDGFLALQIVGYVLGIAGICVNYPIYNLILKNSKKKYGNDIVALAKEIEKEETDKKN